MALFKFSQSGKFGDRFKRDLAAESWQAKLDENSSSARDYDTASESAVEA